MTPRRYLKKGKTMKTKLFIVALLTTVMSGVVCADGAALYAEKTCIACHGKDGKKTLTPAYPKVAGQNAAYIEAQMKDIKNGVRTNGSSAAMKGVMHLVSDAEIKELALYISKLK
jgi:cytochrome c